MRQFFVKRVASIFNHMKNLLPLFSLFFFLLAACHHGKESKTTSVASTERQPLSLGVMSTLDGLPFLVAEKQGIYDSLGLNLTIIQFNSSNDRDASFQSGHVDGIVTDYPSAAVLQAYHNNLNIIMKNEGYFCFIVSRESHINQLKQLKEKNIAVSRNTVIEYATDQLLKKAEISTKTVNKPEIGQIPLRQQMLQYSQIDASFLPDPSASIAMNNGHKSLISTQELGINMTGTAFSKKAIKKKSEEIKLLVQGYNLGVEYMQMHPLKDWKQVLTDIGVPDNLTGLIALPLYKKATLPLEKDIDSAVNWLKAHKRVPTTYQGTNLVDTTFIYNTN